MKLKPEKSAGYMTNLVARLFARAIDYRLKQYGISSGQLPVLLTLANGEELSQKALTEIAAIEQPTMAATLARMERDGLISRRTDPDDKRSSLISLTHQAREKAKIAEKEFFAVNEEALSALEPNEREAYIAQLHKVAKALMSQIKEMQ